MAAKQKDQRQPAKSAQSATSPREEVLRLFEKENYKEAVKQAKLLHRAEGGAENRRLLEQAYYRRARQLCDQNLKDSAREVAANLLELKLTDPQVIPPFANLLVEIGMTNAAMMISGQMPASSTTAEAKVKMQRDIADRAVIDPQVAASQPPEVRDGAAAIRAALSAISSGDDAKAADSLRLISRTSVFADWKWLALGLAAFYRQDYDGLRDCAAKLDPDRFPRRIIKPLMVLADPARSRADAKPLTPQLQAVEHAVHGNAVIAQIERLSMLVAQKDWRGLFRNLREIRTSLRQREPEMLTRINRIIYSALTVYLRRECETEAEAREIIAGFSSSTDPLDADPRWNRFRALAYEGGSQYREAENYWKAYLDDVVRIPGLSPSDVKIAQALVWRQIGGLAIEEAEDMEHFASRRRGRGPSFETVREKAIAALESALKLAPDLESAAMAMISSLNGWGHVSRAEAAAKRFLETQPNHHAMIVFLRSSRANQNDLNGALSYAMRALALKPLDRKTIEAAYRLQVAVARRLVIEGKTAEAMQALEAAEKIDPTQRDSYRHLAKKAVCMQLGGDKSQLKELRAQLVASADPNHAGLGWLAMAIEAALCGLPPEARVDCERELRKAFKKKGKPGTAVEMAAMMQEVIVSPTLAYPQRDEHAAIVLDHVMRFSAVSFTDPELRAVCKFLLLMPYAKVGSQLSALAKRGVVLDPDDPFFQLLEMESVLRSNRFDPRKHGEIMRRFVLSPVPAENTEERELLDILKKRVVAAMGIPSDLAAGFSMFGLGFPPIFGGPNFGPPLDGDEYWDDEDGEYDDEGDEEEDDGESLPSPEARAAAKRRKAAKKKQRKKKR